METAGGFALERLDHVQLAMPVGGESREREFYRDLLGLAEIPKPAALAGRGGCWFQGLVCVHVGADESFVPGKRAHPAFQVRGLAALRVRLEGAGHPVVVDDAWPEVERFYTSDPFGNRIEFLEPRTGVSGASAEPVGL